MYYQSIKIPTKNRNLRKIGLMSMNSVETVQESNKFPENVHVQLLDRFHWLVVRFWLVQTDSWNNWGFLIFQKIEILKKTFFFWKFARIFFSQKFELFSKFTKKWPTFFNPHNILDIIIFSLSSKIQSVQLEGNKIETAVDELNTTDKLKNREKSLIGRKTGRNFKKIRKKNPE